MQTPTAFIPVPQDPPPSRPKPLRASQAGSDPEQTRVARAGRDRARAQRPAPHDAGAAVPSVDALPPWTLSFDEQLPVNARRAEISALIEAHQVVIVCGETGSGKTTQLPKICLALGRGRRRMIGHTQPRRLAASSVARRIAQELQTPLGETVGFKVRFTDHTRPGAAIKLMTDGILLAEIQSDPLLRAYDTLIIDEAHERSLNIDFLLGYLKQLLPRRRDLKLIVTSATIDAERFARHFAAGADPAPVIQVSGRLYPVEIRYRPYDEDIDTDPETEEPQAAESAGDLAGSARRAAPGAARRGEERTLAQAVVDAVDELALLGSGDVLVFLPGEREIREIAEALRKHHPPATEILPLFARLSSEEQDRIFRSGGGRRIVLATNIAETSLTVPGIRYVVDSGLARVKRYSYRNKVEQLRIEAVSRAAANQRAGRCGRVAAGVCIRLYAEADFERRPAFTDPEVLRSSLAAVILRMSAQGLGDPGAFPFIDAPPAKAIVDGFQLLAELNAVDEQRKLTAVGERLARMPVDPRVARMLLAASEQHCLAEMLIIAAVLSVQDPRERPLGLQAAADEAHRRHADERSDFLSLVNLWHWVDERQQHKKSNRLLTEEMRAAFVNMRRVREWRDVHGQLAQLVGEQGWRVNTSPATYEQLHRALLAGLLGNIGMKSAEADPADRRDPPFLGARAIKFHLWPGASKARRAARWVVAAELVETSRLFARTVAQIDARWVEHVGRHLLRRSYSDPHWEKKPAQVMVFEKGTLYGLTLYQQRRVPYAPIDAAHAREIFLREALVAGQWETQAPFMQHNLRLMERIRELEHRTRRPDVLVDDEEIYAFYHERVPADVVDAATFEAWRHGAEREQPRLLFLEREALMRHEAAEAATELFPKRWQWRGLSLSLSYHFEPGSVRDGVTLALPVMALNQVDPSRCEWLVPGMIREKVQLLLKSLPQKLRRACVPLPDYAQQFVDRHRTQIWGTDPAAACPSLLETLIRDVRSTTGTVCQPGDFKLETLPAHLTMNIKVIDDHGRQLGMGRNLAALRAEFAPRVEESFRALGRESEALPDAGALMTDWDLGELAEIEEIRRAGQTLVGFPALVDKGEGVALELLDDPGAAAQAHRQGVARLFTLQLRSQLQALEKGFKTLAPLQMKAMSVPGLKDLEPLAGQILAAALERVCLTDPVPRDREAFVRRRDEARGRLGLIAQEIARLVGIIVEEALAARRKLDALKAGDAARVDIEQQFQRLLGRRFVREVPAEALAHYPRYFKAIGLRVDKLKSDPARDALRMKDIVALQTPWLRELAARRGQADPRLEEFRWLLEELRVSLFAQELRTPYPVSLKRLEKFWQGVKG